MKNNQNSRCPGGKKVCMKLAVITVFAVVMIIVLGCFVDENTFSEIKNNFSLWTIIALVVIINLVSFLCFIVMFVAYKWVQCDLKPKDERDNLED